MDKDDLLWWGLGLLGASALLLVLEVFIPSGGLILMGATLSALGGVVALFVYDVAWGLAGLLSVVVLGPIVFFSGLNLWRHTPIGRRIIGEPSDEETEAERKQALDSARARESLIGAEGEVVTELRPVGIVRIDGQRYEALSETFYVKPGTRVRVSAVEGNSLKVRPLT